MLYISLFYVLGFNPTNKGAGWFSGSCLCPLMAGAAVPIYQGGSARGQLSGLIIPMPPNEVRPGGTKPDPKLPLSSSSCAEKHASGFHRQPTINHCSNCVACLSICFWVFLPLKRLQNTPCL